MWNIILFFVAICHCIYAITEEEIKMDLTKQVMKCNKDLAVEMTELMKLQKYEIPTKTETKCVLACAYKEAGIMTKDGLYDLDYAYKIAEQVKNGNDKRLENAKKMADICVKVNDEIVSDGTKGCDRAAMIFKCTIENAPKFGFKL